MEKLRKGQHGLSLMEALVALLIGAIVLTAGATLVTKALQITDLITVRTEMQQDGRAAINSLLKDLSLSGTGMPVGGVQLPTGVGSTPSLFACSGGVCSLKNHTFPANHLYPVLPDANDGKVQKGAPDAITMAYIDRTLSLGTASNITASGSQIDLASVAGINIGDLIMLSNVHGSAIGMVTNVLTVSNTVVFGNSDPLNINQPAAARIDQEGAPLHAPERSRIDNVISLGRQRAMHGDDIRLFDTFGIDVATADTLELG